MFREINSQHEKMNQKSLNGFFLCMKRPAPAPHLFKLFQFQDSSIQDFPPKQKKCCHILSPARLFLITNITSWTLTMMGKGVELVSSAMLVFGYVFSASPQVSFFFFNLQTFLRLAFRSYPIWPVHGRMPCASLGQVFSFFLTVQLGAQVE